MDTKKIQDLAEVAKYNNEHVMIAQVINTAANFLCMENGSPVLKNGFSSVNSIMVQIAQEVSNLVFAQKGDGLISTSDFWNFDRQKICSTITDIIASIAVEIGVIGSDFLAFLTTPSSVLSEIHSRCRAILQN